METGADTTSVLAMLLSRRQQQLQQGGVGARTTAGGRVFECKTCGRGFPTFQALGGHRASHRRPRPYGAPPPHEGGCAAAGPRVHGCPVCGLQFAVGQALAGHMRRHRAAPAAADSGDALRAGDATSVEDAVVVGADCAGGVCLDLNLAPSENCAKCRKNAVHGNTVQGVQKTFILGCPI